MAIYKPSILTLDLLKSLQGRKIILKWFEEGKPESGFLVYNVKYITYIGNGLYNLEITNTEVKQLLIQELSEELLVQLLDTSSFIAYTSAKRYLRISI